MEKADILIVKYGISAEKLMKNSCLAVEITIVNRRVFVLRGEGLAVARLSAKASWPVGVALLVPFRVTLKTVRLMVQHVEMDQ